MFGPVTHVMLSLVWSLAAGQAPQAGGDAGNATQLGRSNVAVRYADPFLLREQIVGEGVDVEIQITADGQLAITGPSEDVYRAKRLAKQYDVPEADPNYHSNVVIRIPLMHYPAVEVPDMLHIASREEQTRLAVDERNNAVIVAGPSGEVQQIKELIKEIDTPKQSLRLEFYFIRATIGGDAKGASNLPETLKPVAAALAEAGFHNLHLIAPIQILTEEGETLSGQSFSQEASLDVPLAGGQDGAQYRYSFRIGGSAQVAPEAQVVKLAITATASGSAVNAEGRVLPGSMLDYQVQTRISAGLGQYVVLSAAPGTTPEGSALALVLRVDR